MLGLKLLLADDIAVDFSGAVHISKQAYYMSALVAEEMTLSMNDATCEGHYDSSGT